MMHNSYGLFWGMHWIWWILWILFLVWIFTSRWEGKGQRKNPDTPMDILKKRFARGEITKEEYEERKRILENDTL